MAIARANFENIPINLVTAVPSIETYENIRKGKYSISKLSERFKKASLPNHEIINLNKVKLDKNSWLSNAVVQKVNDHLNKKDQVLFFLNRRGFSPHVFCKKCLYFSRWQPFSRCGKIIIYSRYGCMFCYNTNEII